MQNFVEIASTVAEISRFFDISRWRQPPSYFRNLNFLTVGTFKHHCAKFHRNRLNRGRDTIIFRFFKMAAAAILDCRNFKFLTFVTVKRVELHAVSMHN